MEKKKNVPVLRFPEFSGEWEKKKLSEVSKFLDGRRKPIKESDRSKIKGSYPYYGASGIIDYVNDYIFDEEIILLGEDGENIISRNSPLAFKVSGKCWINNHAHVIKPNEVSDIDFLTLSLERISFIKYNTGTAQPKLNQEICNGIIIPYTSIDEQKKIASFITALDIKLQALKKKKNLLEQYKKGMMQKIFSQELRFKDGSGSTFPEWEMKTLGEIAEKKSIKNKNNNVKNVFTNSASVGIVNQRDYFDKDIANQNNLLNYYIVENNDFIYNPRISNLAPVGPIGRNHLETGVMSPLYSVFKFSQGNLDFFEIFFSTTGWHEYMESIANYGARADRMNITTENFYLMPVPFPCLEEQTKIAIFLSAIDDKINLCNTQIEKTEQWKKGLLQKMFV